MSSDPYEHIPVPCLEAPGPPAEAMPVKQEAASAPVEATPIKQEAASHSSAAPRVNSPVTSIPGNDGQPDIESMGVAATLQEILRTLARTDQRMERIDARVERLESGF
ncbi:hypothetical protein CONLIGDRAFT_677738 [Coniochaeta ligniaria NRRL 30616]|uniref:Uncharacterized protein n=1 Tax=Coniochaeta ligniaria NRRL 30616 TaxID=1408157 RepID=A0A1J7K1K9_9PEZI|nr:hypothetical protein CONLIGDRAFT_677738 [Coniochaeta ligniaria NRRL 30616]